MLKELPLESSPLFEVAFLNEQLPKDTDCTIQLRESNQRTFNETLVNTLCIIQVKSTNSNYRPLRRTPIDVFQLVRKLGGDGVGAPMSSSVTGYLEIAATLLPSSLEDVMVFRQERERVLGGLGLDPRRAMPFPTRLPLAGSTVVQRITQTVHPELFEREVRQQGNQHSPTRHRSCASVYARTKQVPNPRR
ncbi:hypothetical protein Y032_0276g1101 [Ancylostoma ceylanicum]|uniref:Uncharacterized protein n=1 Tax=Ancylostoma ceylanicum TaxID=53326 RepID=A0A016S7H3_9BILA|nr:hypothetical protein Y032_0276g1101 [Ancylostoma ceylanicum]